MIVDSDHHRFAAEVRRLTITLPRESPPGYRQVVLAYDGSPGARAALERAAAVVDADATLTVIAVIPFESVGASPDPISAEKRAWQWHRLTEATALLERRGISAFVEAAAGNPASVIVEVARALEADLIVLGRETHRRGRLPLKSKSVRRSVAQRADCDVLIVSS